MLDEFQKLEEKYAVEDIKVNGIQMWPMLRIYIASQVVFDQDRSAKISGHIMLSIAKYLFRGFWNIFKKTDYILFSSSDQRKKIDGFYVDKMDMVAEKLPNSLIVELPSNGKHLKKKLYPNPGVISKYPFYVFTILFSKLHFAYKIEGEQILKDIMKESGITIPYQRRIKIFMAERMLMSKLIKWKKLKGFLLITPYTNMGYVYAFREKNLPVIEFQHGTISKSHYAYNIVKKFDDCLFPEYLLTFGRKEKEVFIKDNYYINPEKVVPIGSMMIDRMMTKKPMDERFDALAKKYKRTVAFTAQDALEKQFIPFLIEAASMDDSIAYILVPRYRDIAYYAKFNFPENVHYMPWLSAYELLYLCDFHSTINSTTAIEAPSLGTINVLANIENRAKAYFENLIDSKVCLYTEEPASYVQVIREMSLNPKEEIASINEGLIERDFGKNLDSFIKSIIQRHA